ncbi:M56 family metallopeptidase [Parasphingorhabdus sp. DH2-15]|uniref:M56 family metallopeptidase n=1 Tax=Parasphingorhabdus sp. DH2-15 TaxID=3444112 RepID=UPI003F6888B9
MTISAFFSDMPFWQQWVTDTIIATALLMALVLLLRRSVARLFGPQIAYLLWLVPAIRLLMPAYSQTIEIEAAAIASLPDIDALSSSAIAASASHDALSGTGSSAAGMSFELLPFVLTLWLGGAALFLIVQLASYLQQRAEILSDGQEVDLFDDIKVIQVAGIDSPFAFGVFHRFIAIPLDFYAKYSPIEQQLALRHELAHHQARDLLANFAALTLLSLHWFNPLAWMAYRAFRFDQEAACDARVLASSDAQERHSYGRLIAKAATGRTLALASPLTPKEKLCERLTLMSQSRKSKFRRRVGAMTIAIAAATALSVTATVSYAYEIKAPTAPIAPAVAQTAPAAPSVSAVPEAMPVPFATATPVAAPTAPPAVEAKEEAERDKAAIAGEKIEKAKKKKVNTVVIGDRRTVITTAGNGAPVIVKVSQENSNFISEQEALKIADDALASLDVDTLIPNITLARDCSKGEDTEEVSSKTVNGRLVMVIGLCNATKLAEARSGALEGLREARDDIANDSDIPESFRKRLKKVLDQQIRQLEGQELGSRARSVRDS